MQLCQIHFYQKIARKKVARVNAALGRYKCDVSATFKLKTSFLAYAVSEIWQNWLF